MIEATERSFVVGREELAPLSVEMHYFRVPKRYWSICFERIKRAGFRIISTQIPWNVHETADGRFDFNGIEDAHRDLTVFLELAREFGFKVIIRPGPWIAAEWMDHGLPRYLLKHREILAHDAKGEPLAAKSAAGESPGAVPSYLHPVYISAVKRYFQALADVIRNYVYPRGPIFMIELDGRPNHGGHLGCSAGDYNPATLEHYPEYLQAIYSGNIKALNSVYGTSHKSFTEITPPMSADEVKKPEQLPAMFDWLAFQSYTLDEYIQILRDVWIGLDAEPFFVYEQAHHGAYGLPLPDRSGEDPAVLPSITVDWSCDFYTTLYRLRALAGVSPFPMTLRFAVGHYSSEPEIKARYAPIGEAHTRFLLITALASGLKMLNAYMFVDRDRWYGGAVTMDGGIGPAYDTLQKLEQVLEQLPVPALRQDIQIGFGVPRSYVDYTLVGENPPVLPLIHTLLDRVIPGLHRDFSAHNYAVAATDFSVSGPWQAWPILVVPSGPFMDADIQESLAASARAGQQIVLVGDMPLLDNQMKHCTILCRAMGARTFGKPGLADVKGFGYEFPAHCQAFIRSEGMKRLVMAGQKVVGAHKAVGKGGISLLTYDPTGNGDPARLLCLHAFIKSLGEEPSVYASDSEVHLFVNKFDKYAVLYLVAPPRPCSMEDGGKHERDVIIRCDMKKLKLKGKNVKMVELFGGESIKTTVAELKEGITVKVRDYASYAWWLERKG
jgi:beta-galactosidase